VLAAIRRIEGKGKLESARRSLQLASAVFRYAVATARLASDPTRDLRGALTAPTVTHYGAITDATKAGQLLRAIDDYDGSGITKLALQIAPHVFVRPGELRHAEWSEIDLDDALWVIPAGKMKMRKTHHVPLSRQAVTLFRETQSITGPNGYVFPSVRTRTRPMSENTINAGLRRLGYTSDEMTAHGFRAMASTLLNESGKWNPDAIERALAHGDTDKVRRPIIAANTGKNGWPWPNGGATISTTCGQGQKSCRFPPARPGEGDSHDHSRQQKFAALLFYRCSWCSGVPSPDSLRLLPEHRLC
jgi:integrase